MVIFGSNPAELDGLAAAFARAAELLDANRIRLDSQVHHAPWRGWEADQFRRDWDGYYARQLAGAAAFLHAGRTQLMRNAEEQRQASAADDGRLASPFVPAPTASSWNPAGTFELIHHAYDGAASFAEHAASRAQELWPDAGAGAREVTGALAVGGFAIGLTADLIAGRSLGYAAADSAGEGAFDSAVGAVTGGAVEWAAGAMAGAAIDAGLLTGAAAVAAPVVVGAAIAVGVTVGANYVFHRVFHESPGQAICKMFHL